MILDPRLNTNEASYSLGQSFYGRECAWVPSKCSQGEVSDDGLLPSVPHEKVIPEVVLIPMYASKSVEGSVQIEFTGPSSKFLIQWTWGEAHVFAFLADFQMVLMCWSMDHNMRTTDLKHKTSCWNIDFPWLIWNIKFRFITWNIKEIL